MKSFLSDSVTCRLINNPPSYDPQFDNCFGLDLLLDWDRVNETMGNISDHGWKEDGVLTSEKENEFYFDKTQKLWFLINSAGKIWKQSSPDVITSMSGHLEWLKREPDEMDCFLTDCCDDAVALEVVLKLTSFLERALGDVYLMIKSPVPFLLRDLLHSSELESALGKVAVRLLNVTMGHVQGVNLRNVAWHGFLSEGEVNWNLIPFLILMAASLGRDLASTSIKHRPYRIIFPDKVALLDDFFVKQAVVVESKSEIIEACPHVASGQRSFWRHAFELFDHHKCGDSLVVLLPVFEHLLRSIYCETNNCSDAMLEATATEFYVILDDILDANFKRQANGLITRLGANVFEALVDVFMAPNGPRIRDRISHGEIRLEDVRFRMAAHIVGLSLHVADATGTKKLTEPTGVEPKFHERAVLKRKLTESAMSLQCWNILHVESDIQWKSLEVESILCALTGHRDVESLIKDSLKTVSSAKIDSLTRRNSEIESLMKSIAVNVCNASANARVNVTTRSSQYKNKQMRSRSRTNYLLMLDVLPVFRATLALLIFIIVRLFTTEFSLDATPPKHFRSFLKYAENAKTMSSLGKNRWLELEKSCKELINFVQSVPLTDLIKKT